MNAQRPHMRRHVVEPAHLIARHEGPCRDDINGLLSKADRQLLQPSNLVAEAHRLALVVHPFTFRNEPTRLVADYRGNPVNECLQFYQLGVDGVFSDFADTAVVARILFEMLREEKFVQCLVDGVECHRGGACDGIVR